MFDEDLKRILESLSDEKLEAVSDILHQFIAHPDMTQDEKQEYAEEALRNCRRSNALK